MIIRNDGRVFLTAVNDEVSRFDSCSIQYSILHSYAVISLKKDFEEEAVEKERVHYEAYTQSLH